jgi:hypothetical protein
MEQMIFGAILVLGLPTFAIARGWWDLRKPGHREEYDRRNAGRDPFGSDSWGPG